MNKTISQRSLTSNQKFMVFILAMTMFGLSDLVTQIIPEFSIGFIELRVPYFAFIAVSLAILFDPLSVALGAAFGGVIFGG
ncbi:MAG: cell division protein FtsQ, partial [Terrisporobacter sp.]